MRKNSYVIKSVLTDLPNNHVVINTDQVQITAKTDLKSKVIKILNAGSTVKIYKEEKVNNQIWVYVDTGYSDADYNKIEGWIQKEKVTYLKDFKKVEKFQDCYMEFTLGDTSVSIDFFLDGTYESENASFYDNGDKLKINEKRSNKINGRIYKFNNVICVGGSFYVVRNGKVCTVSPDNPPFYSKDGKRKK